jgi:tryptophan-rich sensory protein
MKNWQKATIALLLPQIAGFTAALVTETGEGSWYRSIAKPSWNPPGWLFAPVWTSLYVMMGIAFYLIWKSDAFKNKKQTAMFLWVLQLVANFSWSLIFFGAHQIAYALIEMGVLWLLIFATIVSFARINKPAAWLLVPYINWVSFAFLLNFTIWRLNS